MKRTYLIIFLFLYLLNSVFLFSQGDACDTAEPFCAGSDSLVFENGTTQTDLGEINCLANSPNPAWFYLKIAQSGDLDLEIKQGNNPPNYNNLDVDFICWGPFSEPNCSDLFDYSTGTSVSNNVIACSYSTDAIENFVIPNAQVGEYYMVLVTNFSGNPGFISMTQTNDGQSGAGQTDCSIVTCSVSLGDDQVLCQDTLDLTADFNVVSQAAAPVDMSLATYQWYLDGVLQPSLTTRTISISQSGVWKVIASHSECDQGVEDEVLIHEKPEVLLSNDEFSFCDNGAIEVQLSGNYQGISFSWSSNSDSNVSGASSATGTSINDQLVVNSGITGQVVYTVTPDYMGCRGESKDVIVNI